VLNKISERMGIGEDKIKQEIARRKAVLEWMLKRKIFDYREVARVINMYYTNPEKLLDYITSG
jgi:hypothetical protein